MAMWTPDPTFYPSPRLASQAPPEKLAYVASLDPTRKRPDVMMVVDLDSESGGYGQIVGQTDLAIGDELHHFGWNACSSCLCPNAPHPHIERRYLIVPGIRSSRLHVLDTKWMQTSCLLSSALIKAVSSAAVFKAFAMENSTLAIG
jgi:selenium-binding protein 1